MWFRSLAWINRTTWQVDLLRYGLLGVGAPQTILAESVAFAGFTAVCLAFAVRTINRAA